MPRERRNRQREAWADMAQVARIYEQMGERVPPGTYGPFVGSPEDTKAARLQKEDEESYWANLLSLAPDVEADNA